MDTLTYRARIEKTQIGFLNSIIESYEGIAVVRTLHAPSGVVELWVAPCFEDIVTALLHDLAAEIGLEYAYKATRRLTS
jgi:predicted HD phosphohydrolase